jgi:transcription elongation factor Elf1
MKTNENYTCPTCGSLGNITTIVPIMSDVRFDEVQCPNCGTSWRVYYKVVEPRVEVFPAAPQPIDRVEVAPIENEPVTEDSTTEADD